jgi:hypothetical protein
MDLEQILIYFLKIALSNWMLNTASKEADILERNSSVVYL